MIHRNDDLLLRIAQGDAYGAGFEYVRKSDSVWAEHTLTRYAAHPTHRCRGVYTDDTQMSVAVTEVLLEGPPFTRERFADAFVRCFRRDRRDGYARGFQAFLESVCSGAEFLARIRPDSDKNGACMRAVPIGVLPTVDEVLALAETQARITHDTRDGVYSAQAVALMSHLALMTDMPLLAFCVAIEQHLPNRDFPPVLGGTAGWTWDDYRRGRSVAMATACAVYHLVVTAARDPLADVLRSAVDIGGDTDSVAAIAMGIASCRLRDPLPEFLERDLESNGAYGVPFLKGLGKRLMERYDR